MNKEIISLALKFLERVQLNGAEVPAFNAVVSALLAAKDAPDGKTDVTNGNATPRPQGGG